MQISGPNKAFSRTTARETELTYGTERKRNNLRQAGEILHRAR